MLPADKEHLVHCPTPEDAEAFFNEAHLAGYCWGRRGYSDDDTLWNAFREETCYQLIEDLDDDTKCVCGHIRVGAYSKLDGQYIISEYVRGEEIDDDYDAVDIENFLGGFAVR